MIRCSSVIPLKVCGDSHRNRTGANRQPTLACLAGEKTDIANPQSDGGSKKTVSAAAFQGRRGSSTAAVSLSPRQFTSLS